MNCPIFSCFRSFNIWWETDEDRTFKNLWNLFLPRIKYSIGFRAAKMKERLAHVHLNKPWKFQIEGHSMSLNFLLFWTFNCLLNATLCVSIIKIGQQRLNFPNILLLLSSVWVRACYYSMCPSCCTEQCSGYILVLPTVWVNAECSTQYANQKGPGPTVECPGSISPLYFGACNCMKADCSTQYVDQKGWTVELECTGSISPPLSLAAWPLTDHCVCCSWWRFCLYLLGPGHCLAFLMSLVFMKLMYMMTDQPILI